MRVTDTHIYFWGGRFSNFFPITFFAENHKFYTSEQYYMWRKAKFFEDEENAELILNVKSPADAKALGRKVRNYDDKLWSEVRYQIMVKACVMKFNASQNMFDFIVNTGDKVLVEASPFDRIWGVGLTQDNDDILFEHRWKGENLLGKALMEVRDFIQMDPADMDEITNLEICNIDPKDHPKYCDAYYCYGEYNGLPLNENQLDKYKEQNSEFFDECIQAQIR